MPEAGTKLNETRIYINNNSNQDFNNLFNNVNLNSLLYAEIIFDST